MRIGYTRQRKVVSATRHVRKNGVQFNHKWRVYFGYYLCAWSTHRAEFGHGYPDEAPRSWGTGRTKKRCGSNDWSISTGSPNDPSYIAGAMGSDFDPGRSRPNDGGRWNPVRGSQSPTGVELMFAVEWHQCAIQNCCRLNRKRRILSQFGRQLSTWISI